MPPTIFKHMLQAQMECGASPGVIKKTQALLKEHQKRCLAGSLGLCEGM
jgi:hypothetical protein